ncbi:MAG: glycoside hydrolase family 9 protein [Fimbriimonas sp.]|nr:glycoside hydrolase family 9 protein [Fimbriimonas sp.]
MLLIAMPRAIRPDPILLDDCERGIAHQGISWSAFGDGASDVSPKPFAFSEPGYRSGHSAHMSYRLRAGARYSFAGMTVSMPAKDLSACEGIRFRARGQGPCTCSISTAATSVSHDEFGTPFFLDPSWRVVEIPFDRMAQMQTHGTRWNRKGAVGVVWLAGGYPGQTGWLDVDDVEFYGSGDATLPPPESNVVLAEPKVNQLGFRPDAPKAFVIAEGTSGPHGGAPFRIVDDAGTVRFAGHLSANPIDDRESTGERVFQGDFSSLLREGRFRVVVGNERSLPFRVGKNVYRPLYASALQCFRLIRCGAAVDDPATGIRHPACHPVDASFHGEGPKLDLTGGWHNACDYGKWVLEASISCAWMLNLAELAHDSDPNLLAEARWGLDWIQKMQRPDGGFLSKVDAEDHFCSSTSPDQDPFPRYYKPASCISTGDAVGALCLASRVFRPSDPAYALRCFESARRGWTWIEAHPDSVYLDADYVDRDASQEKLWALGEMARTTGDPVLRQRWEKDSKAVGLHAPSWMEPHFFGYLAQRSRPDAIAAIRRLCDPMVAASDANGYRVLLSPYDYTWESNESLLYRTATLLCCHRLTGERKYRDAAQRQLDWLLGTNGLGLSFVTGFGARSVKHPWHWTAMALGKLMPGWVAGGANRFESGDPLGTEMIRRGTPPAKCFVDANAGNGSWSTNEGETSENAALVFVAGYLSHAFGAPDPKPISTRERIGN